jgi:hypothetical protein
VDVFGAGDDGAVGRALELHTLFDDCGARVWEAVISLGFHGNRLVHRGGLPSNGFINASLAVVAMAPANAVPPTPRSPSRSPPATSLTNSYVPKCMACAGPAPMITLATPRQSVRRDWVVDACRRWERRDEEAVRVDDELAPGVWARRAEGDNEGRTCIRVCDRVDEVSLSDCFGSSVVHG